MPITFLEAMNSSLRRVGEIAGDSEALSTSTVTSTATGAILNEPFTDSRRQHKIDVMVQLWNESIHTLFSLNLLPRSAGSATLALVADQREYDLPDDFEGMEGETSKARVLRGATTGRVIGEYPGGYARLLADRPTATDYTGEPNYWAVSPVSSKISLDNYPTSDDAGKTYNYLYRIRLALTSTMATSTFPFSDTVVEGLFPVVAEAYNRVFKQDYDQDFMINALTLTFDYARPHRRRDTYGRRRVSNIA
jgi:hypothetical protein